MVVDILFTIFTIATVVVVVLGGVPLVDGAVVDVVPLGVELS